MIPARIPENQSVLSLSWILWCNHSITGRGTCKLASGRLLKKHQVAKVCKHFRWWGEAGAGRGRAWVCSIRCLPSLRPCEYLNGWLRSCLAIISEHDFMWHERHANNRQKPSERSSGASLFTTCKQKESSCCCCCGSLAVITFFTYLTFKTCNEKCTKYINCTRVAVAANAQRWKTPRDAAAQRRRIIYIYHAERKCNKFAPQRIARVREREERRWRDSCWV